MSKANVELKLRSKASTNTLLYCEELIYHYSSRVVLLSLWTHLSSTEKKIFPSSFKKEASVLCVCLSQGYGNTFHKAAGACMLCSQACSSVIVHHRCLCARAPNNGLSWSSSTCLAEAFKSFSLQELLLRISVTNS